MNPIDQAKIRDLVADHAADYYGGPLNLSASDAARYTTEGHVDKALPHINWRQLCTLVAAEIDANPGVLTTSKATREQARLARNAEAERLIEAAFEPYQRGEFARAAALIDQAELVAPLHRPAGRTYAQYREFVTSRAEVA